MSFEILPLSRSWDISSHNRALQELSYYLELRWIKMIKSEFGKQAVLWIAVGFLLATLDLLEMQKSQASPQTYCIKNLHFLKIPR